MQIQLQFSISRSIEASSGPVLLIRSRSRDRPFLSYPSLLPKMESDSPNDHSHSQT
jgi:hypothetical protein